MAKWIGFAVSVNCGEPLGCYQGTILKADGSTITLNKAFRNGFPYPKSQVTLNAADIKELKIIEQRAEPAGQTHSTVAITKGSKKGQRATVCENLQANPSSSGHQQNNPPDYVSGNNNNNNATPMPVPTNKSAARSKPIDIQPNPRNNKNVSHAGSFGGGAGSTPKGRGGDRARRRNEACFGGAADTTLDHDFDFEGNLALFDKRALWEQMSAQRPDVVRTADGAKFRHDENVLGGAPGPRRAIHVPDAWREPLDYVTDDGTVVPGVPPYVRRALWSGLSSCGSSVRSTALTLLSRAAADVALRLVGGGRRLEPRNAHQAPTVAVLAARHAAGAAGLKAARLLSAHGVRVAVHVPDDQSGNQCDETQDELDALSLSNVTSVPLEQLPSPDLVVVALHEVGAESESEGWCAPALAWTRQARAAIVCLEPPAAGCGLSARATVQALLPSAIAEDLGRLYLANVAPPTRLFNDLRITYRPPFGAASVLALHPADD